MSNVQANNTLLNQTQPIKPCDISTPYVSSGNCINCFSPTPYFNLTSQQCEDCPSNTNYNNVTHKCQPKATYYPNLTNPNWTVNAGNDPQKVIDMKNTLAAVPGSQPCPAGAEFYNNQTNQCVSCPAGQIYNYDTLQCFSCDSPYRMDPNTGQCCKDTQGISQTSLSSPNLMYSGIPAAQYQDQYNSNVATYPGIQDCPSTKPFFDGCGCVQCPSTKPYFNLQTKVCQSCDAPAVYNPDDK